MLNIAIFAMSQFQCKLFEQCICQGLVFALKIQISFCDIINKKPNMGITKEDKRNLKDFLETHTEIKAKAKEIALLRKKFKMIKENIGVFMKGNKLDVLDVGGHDIVYKNNKMQASLSKDFLAAQTKEFFRLHDPNVKDNIGDEFVKFLWEKKKEQGKERERITVRTHRVRKSQKKEAIELAVEAAPPQVAEQQTEKRRPKRKREPEAQPEITPV